MPMMGSLKELAAIVLLFWRSMTFFTLGGSYADAPSWFKDLPNHTKTHLYSLTLIFRLWNQPHYRSGTFQQDMLKNLRNVAIPRTGIPLSAFCHSKIVALFFVFIAYPVIALVAAIHAAMCEPAKKSVGDVAAAVVEVFREQLLAPRDWFSLWRLNCRLASYHSGKTQAEGYSMEDKWTFLQTAEELGIPISPCMRAHEIVMKDRNEEGGMGIHFFKNALHGGDWIIQERLQNDGFVSSLLPSDAPLSTFRVITCSRGGGLPVAESKDMVVPLSCVFRAGRAGAKTDHSSILFDVDLKTGDILKGTTNAHWYKLGAKGLWTAWTSEQNMTHHPDCNVKITGRRVPDIKVLTELCVSAHRKMMPDVTMAGWDVALTTQGPLLLEANLSCNFFRGTFDEDQYFNLVDEYFVMLEGSIDNKALCRRAKRVDSASELGTEVDTDTPSDVGAGPDSESSETDIDTGLKQRSSIVTEVVAM